MANAYAMNFSIPGNASIFQCAWKLTRVMKKAGWEVVAHSDGVTKTSAGTNSNDAWGSDADPNSDAYPVAFDTRAPWIVLRGPTTLKINLSAAPTGSPLRGEALSQANTGATGELLGYVWDTTISQGWMVIAPRTGEFNSSDTITAASSAATFTGTGAVNTYLREVMVAKTNTGNTLDGQIYYVCAEAASEGASQLFSQKAATTGCTATVAPGSGGTNNGFPSKAICIRGTSGTTTGASFFGTTSGYNGNCHIGVANAVSGTGVSPDGSFFTCLSTTTANSLGGIMFTRVDDSEPGDVDPYAWVYTNGTVTMGTTTWSRTTATSTGGSAFPFNGGNLFGQSYASSVFYQARGHVSSSYDLVGAGSCGVLYSPPGAVLWQMANSPKAHRLVNHPNSGTMPLVREPIWFICTAQAQTGTVKQIKGRARWLYAVSQGATMDTYDSKSFVCVSGRDVTYPAIIAGPIDPNSTPVP